HYVYQQRDQLEHYMRGVEEILKNSHATSEVFDVREYELELIYGTHFFSLAHSNDDLKDIYVVELEEVKFTFNTFPVNMLDLKGKKLLVDYFLIGDYTEDS
ncbi:hypothetical protein ACJX0J_020967, partial [Zea mays]